MLDRLHPGDLLLEDRYFCSYFMITLLEAPGVDVRFGQPQRRITDFGKGQRLGPKHHVVRWSKPMAQAAWAQQRRVRQMSFTGALQAAAGVMGQASTADEPLLRRSTDEKLEPIASADVGNRSNQVEPHASRRRPRKQKLLTELPEESRADSGAATPRPDRLERGGHVPAPWKAACPKRPRAKR